MVENFMSHANQFGTEVIEEDGVIKILKPWGRDEAYLEFEKTDISIQESLNKIGFEPKYDAIFHRDENVIEFIGFFVSKDDDIQSRKFNFVYDGFEINCGFVDPSDEFINFCKCVKSTSRFSENINFAGLTAFVDKYTGNIRTSRHQEYIDGKVAINFKMKFPCDYNEFDLEKLFQSFNVVCSYFDRHSPQINIHEYEQPENLGINKVVKSFLPEFPSVLVGHEIDPNLYQLYFAAFKGNVRNRFLHYFQVIEYVGNYYVEYKVKSKLENTLKDPIILNCSDTTVSRLMDLVKDLNQNDDVKMRKCIEEYCDPRLIWIDVENNIEFFSKDQEFDGGFKAKALVSIGTDVESWNTMWTPKLFDSLIKIRNCIVHARERREGRVIAPTKYNDDKLYAYIPLIRRIAEQLIIYGNR